MKIINNGWYDANRQFRFHLCEEKPLASNLSTIWLPHSDDKVLTSRTVGKQHMVADLYKLISFTITLLEPIRIEGLGILLVSRGQNLFAFWIWSFVVFNKGTLVLLSRSKLFRVISQRWIWKSYSWRELKNFDVYQWATFPQGRLVIQ